MGEFALVRRQPFGASAPKPRAKRGEGDCPRREQSPWLPPKERASARVAKPSEQVRAVICAMSDKATDTNVAFIAHFDGRLCTKKRTGSPLPVLFIQLLVSAGASLAFASAAH